MLIQLPQQLEQNQSKRALVENLKGGFFLRKKPLEGIAPGYSYSDFALISHARSSSRRAGRSEVSFTVAVNGLRIRTQLDEGQYPTGTWGRDQQLAFLNPSKLSFTGSKTIFSRQYLKVLE
jgi:hypothetical protein